MPFNDNLVHGTASRRPERADPGRRTTRLAGAGATGWCSALERAPRASGRSGSTTSARRACPACVAKDVIDLQVGVRDLADADDPAFVRALRDLGFPRSEGNVQDTVHDWATDPADWQKRFHGSADPGRVAHVHVRRVGSPGHEAGPAVPRLAARLP